MTATQYAAEIQRIIAHADALASDNARHARNAADIVSRTSDRMQRAQ